MPEGPSPSDREGSARPPKSRKAAADLRNSKAYLPESHRQLPQSLDAEKGLLCSALLDPNEILDLCITRKIEPDSFYFPAHALIFETLLQMRESQKPIDLISLSQELTDRKEIDQVGGAAALGELFAFVPTSANAHYYLEILRNKHLLRRMINTCTEFAARGYDEQGDVEVLLDEVEKNIFSIGEQRVNAEMPALKDLVMKSIDNIEKLVQNRGGITGVSTGFKELDRMTGGLHGSEMFVLAARPSMGKTALAMNIAEYVALSQKLPVGVFSLEMAAQQLVERLLFSIARVDGQKLRDGFMGRQDHANLARAAQELSTAPIFIDDTAGLSILELRAKARRMRDRHNIRFLVIDYLQLLKSTSRRAQDNRQLEVSEISYGVKALAKELDIPIMVLAQLNRNPESREGGKPRLSDLRESGTIEQDADVVALLVRSAYYEKDEEPREEEGGRAELIIAKQRNGPTGEVPLTFLKRFARFENCSLAKEPES
jgi:replicative DNA helicase